MRLGALEAGGTKMVCSIGDETGRVFSRVSYPTLSPAETMPKLIEFFKSESIDALGVASFGPIDLHEDSPTYGYITSTPKKGWTNYPFLPELREAIGVPCGYDNDVNAAAIAEHRMGAAKGLSSCIYVTVGTGVGAGIVVENKIVHGLVHPEFGHFWLRPHPDDPMPHGCCPFHDGCLEGMASGPAILKRWGKPAQELAPDHPAWALESYYLAQMCMTAILVLSPEKIVLGGGVMQQEHLFPMIRKQVREMLNGYVQNPKILGGMEDYIVAPGLGINSGVTGALILAAEAMEKE